jgi:hypothetical protein
MNDDTKALVRIISIFLDLQPATANTRDSIKNRLQPTINELAAKGNSTSGERMSIIEIANELGINITI